MTIGRLRLQVKSPGIILLSSTGKGIFQYRAEHMQNYHMSLGTEPTDGSLPRAAI